MHWVVQRLNITPLPNKGYILAVSHCFVGIADLSVALLHRVIDVLGGLVAQIERVTVRSESDCAGDGAVEGPRNNVLILGCRPNNYILFKTILHRFAI